MTIGYHPSVDASRSGPLLALLALDHLVSGPTAWQVREEDDFDGDELARITPKVAVCSLARASFPCPPLLRNKASQL